MPLPKAQLDKINADRVNAKREQEEADAAAAAYAKEAAEAKAARDALDADLGGLTSDPVPPPVITSFTANPASITAGESTTLTAEFSNGTATLDGADWDGTAKVVTPSANTAFKLVVTGDGGTAEASVSVAVAAPPPAPVITSFTANPTSIKTGESTTLAAEFSNGTATLDGENWDGAAKVKTPSADKTFKLVVTGDGGQVEASTSVTVAAAPPPATVSPLANLKPGFLRDLGDYADWSDPKWSPGNIVDDSGCVYDPDRKRIVQFGGGHGPCLMSHIRAIDFMPGGPGPAPLKWYNASPITPLADMVPSNLDVSWGWWIKTKTPTARHTYSATCSPPGKNKFVCLQARGMPDGGYAGPVPSGTSWGGRIWTYDYNTKEWWFSPKWVSTQDHWGTGPAGTQEVPWFFDAACEWDPVANKILVIASSGYAGPTGVWHYDVDTDTITGGVKPAGGGTLRAHVIRHCPINDKFYAFTISGATPMVLEFTVNRADMSKTTCVQKSNVGAPTGPWSKFEAIAWDMNHKMFGGMALNNVFSMYDPIADKWYSQQMKLEAPQEPNAELPRVNFHQHVYDPDSGCHVFLHLPSYVAGAPRKNRTWAYRWDPSTVTGGGTTVAPFSIGTTTYQTLDAAATAAKDGDTIKVEPGTYAGQAVNFGSKKNISIVCSKAATGGRARFVGGVASLKGTFVVGSGFTFDGIEITGARGSQENEAGVRVEGAGFTMRRFYLADNNNGILAGNGQPTSDILLEDGVAIGNGYGDGQSHNFYIGDHRSLTVRRVRSEDANVGHLVKSRCATTIIEDCQLREGRASRAIDACWGGVLIVRGNTTISQAQATNNSAIIGFGQETGGKAVHPNNSVTIAPTVKVYDGRNPTGAVLQLVAGLTPTVDNQAQRVTADPIPAL